MVDVAQLVRAPDCDSGGRGFKSRLPPHKTLARVAQLAECLIRNEDVGGSIPSMGTKKDESHKRTVGLHKVRACLLLRFLRSLGLSFNGRTKPWHGLDESSILSSSTKREDRELM